jgi:hypothetical protein
VAFDQDSVTKVWHMTIPSQLKSGRYHVIIRDRVGASPANTDTKIAMVLIEWDVNVQSLKVLENSVFVSY